jgi:hypothetical protein
MSVEILHHRRLSGDVANIRRSSQQQNASLIRENGNFSALHKRVLLGFDQLSAVKLSKARFQLETKAKREFLNVMKT